MKVWLLDNGSIVIEHTQLMWNVPGPQARIPVYSVLVQSDDGLFLFDTGIDLDHMNRVLPFELPEQTPEQTIPAQLEACGFAVSDVTALVNSHLHIDHVGGNKYFAGHENGHPCQGGRAGAQPRAVRVLRLLRPLVGLRGPRPRSRHGRLRARQGDLPVRDARPHGRPLLAAPEAGGDARPLLFGFDVAYTAGALEKGIQPGFHNDPSAGVRSIRRIKELAAEHGAEIFYLA